MSNRSSNKQITSIVFFFALLLGWQASDFIFDFNPIILPSPYEIFKAILDNFNILIEALSVTAFEAIAGFILGGCIAYFIAILFIFYPLLETLLYPYAVAIKATPLIAIAPLIVLWFGNEMLSKIIMAALVSFFPVLVNSVQGLKDIDQPLLDTMKLLNASKIDTLIKLRIPHSIGYLFSSLRISSSLAVVGAVIGEFVGANQGIGFLIKNASYYLDTALMFAAVIFISIFGIVFFSFFIFLEKILVTWKGENR
ncbi:ABC transporter permease [Magnetococcales bacterium HHB-1]